MERRPLGQIRPAGSVGSASAPMHVGPRHRRARGPRPAGWPSSRPAAPWSTPPTSTPTATPRRLLGELVEEFEVRDEVVLATKAVSRSADRAAVRTPRAGTCCVRSTPPCGASRTEHVDLWQLHAWDPWTPLDETLAAVDDAVTSGKVRYVGVSNYSGWQMSRAATWQQAVPGRAPPGDGPDGVLPARARHRARGRAGRARRVGMGILPWSPLGRGVLTGKYRHGIPIDSRGAYVDTSPAWVQVVPRRAWTPHRGRARDGRRGARRLSDRGRARVGARPARRRRADPRRAHEQPAVAALASEELELPEEILIALDDVSSPPMGYPESGWAQRR